MSGFVLWFTGLSGAGKSTLANLTAVALRERGVTVEILDGDEIRTHLSKGLGFSREDRDTSVRRIGYVAKIVSRVGACAITAAISPYRETRDEVRAQIERFVEVYLACSIPVLAARDPKGLYEKALKGEIQNFTGVDDPYEPPLAPEVALDTATMEPAECVAQVLAKLEALGYLEEREEPASPLVDPVGELPVVAELSPEPGDEVEGEVRVALEHPGDEVILAWIASGLAAPVNGPFTERDLVRVQKEGRLERGLLFDGALALATPFEGERVRLSSAGADVARLEGGKLVASSSASRGLASRVRAELAEVGARRVAAMFLDRPAHAGDLYLARVAAESCDRIVVVLLAGTGAPTPEELSAALVAEGFAARSTIVEIAALEGMSGGGLPLARAVAARNLGASELVLLDGDDGLEERRVDVEKELGLALRPRVATWRHGVEIRSDRTRPEGAAWEKIDR